MYEKSMSNQSFQTQLVSSGSSSLVHPSHPILSSNFLTKYSSFSIIGSATVNELITTKKFTKEIKTFETMCIQKNVISYNDAIINVTQEDHLSQLISGQEAVKSLKELIIYYKYYIQNPFICSNDVNTAIMLRYNNNKKLYLYKKLKHLMNSSELSELQSPLLSQEVCDSTISWDRSRKPMRNNVKNFKEYDCNRLKNNILEGLSFNYCEQNTLKDQKKQLISPQNNTKKQINIKPSSTSGTTTQRKSAKKKKSDKKGSKNKSKDQQILNKSNESQLLINMLDQLCKNSQKRVRTLTLIDQSYCFNQLLDKYQGNKNCTESSNVLVFNKKKGNTFQFKNRLDSIQNNKDQQENPYLTKIKSHHSIKQFHKKPKYKDFQDSTHKKSKNNKIGEKILSTEYFIKRKGFSSNNLLTEVLNNDTNNQFRSHNKQHQARFKDPQFLQNNGKKNTKLKNASKKYQTQRFIQKMKKTYNLEGMKTKINKKLPLKWSQHKIKQVKRYNSCESSNQQLKKVSNRKFDCRASLFENEQAKNHAKKSLRRVSADNIKSQDQKNKLFKKNHETIKETQFVKNWQAKKYGDVRLLTAKEEIKQNQIFKEVVKEIRGKIQKQKHEITRTAKLIVK